MPSAVLAAAAIALQSYTGAGSCGASACHGAPRPRAGGNVRQDEYVTWVVKDRHAQAYRTLTEERSRIIARNLRLAGPPEQADRCLDCHAVNAPADRRARTFDLSDGVACESCHGPAEGWLGQHVTRGWTHAQSVAAGMTDLEDLRARARTCLACHLGDERRSVDHEMIAAGHPDLVFELDTFSAAMPAHWRSDPAQGPRAWGAGQAVQLSESLGLLQRRLAARREAGMDEAGAGAAGPGASGPSGRGWPEFAEYECFACHHPLVKDSWRVQRGYEGMAGAPAWNRSRQELALALVRQTDPARAGAAAEDLQTIAAQIAGGAPDAAQIASAAGRLREVLETAATAPVGPEAARALVRSIAGDADRLARSGYRTAEQAAMAVDSLSRPDMPAPMKKAIDLLFEDLKDPARYDPRSFASHLQAVGKLSQ